MYKWSEGQDKMLWFLCGSHVLYQYMLCVLHKLCDLFFLYCWTGFWIWFVFIQSVLWGRAGFWTVSLLFLLFRYKNSDLCLFELTLNHVLHASVCHLLAGFLCLDCRKAKQRKDLKRGKVQSHFMLCILSLWRQEESPSDGGLPGHVVPDSRAFTTTPSLGSQRGLLMRAWWFWWCRGWCGGVSVLRTCGELVAWTLREPPAPPRHCMGVISQCSERRRQGVYVAGVQLYAAVLNEAMSEHGENMRVLATSKTSEVFWLCFPVVQSWWDPPAAAADKQSEIKRLFKFEKTFIFKTWV